MQIDVKGMNTGQKTPAAFSEEMEIPSEYSLLDGKVNVDVTCTLEKWSEFFSVDGEITATVKSVCGLCLTPVEKLLKIKMNDKFSEAPDSFVDENVYGIRSDVLDLSEAVLDGLLLEIPVRFTCKDDCKGLCPECGANLNETECTCETARFDERFAKLKDFFKEV